MEKGEIEINVSVLVKGHNAKTKASEEAGGEGKVESRTSQLFSRRAGRLSSRQPAHEVRPAPHDLSLFATKSHHSKSCAAKDRKVQRELCL